MKKTKIIGLLAITLMWANSCKDFDELQLDPNRATQSHPSLLLTNIEVGTFGFIDVGAALASRMMVFTDGTASEQYYNWQRSGYGRYNNLRQVVKMVEEADRLGLENYKALALFLQSVHVMELTKVFGDVPYTETLAGGTYTPVYDNQQDIYIKVLNDLKAANSALDASKGEITGDIIYNGDILKWRKLINSYSLRILISLSNKTGNTALGVKNRFNEIVSDPATYPIFTSNDDNGALVYYDLSTTTSLTGNRYPFYNNNNFKTAYYMEESFINLLKDKSDPRLFIFADITPDGDDGGLAEDDPDAYGGLDGSAPLADNTSRLVDGEASKVDARYYSDPVNEPSLLLGYAEVEFTLAEAAALGWTTQDPEEHYLNGIHASLDFYGIDAADQDDYVLEPEVVYNPASGVELIITQKYINYFLNGGWEAFYNHRRTGFPEFAVDGGGVLNNGLVPKRWMYPVEEFTLNLANIQAAVSRQYPGGDNINEVMWLLKAE